MRVRFGDVVRLVRDRVDPTSSGLTRYVAGEHMDTDDLRIRRWGDVGDGYLGPAFHMRFKPGQVLYGSRRTYLRKIALADFEGICANTTYVLESADQTVLLPELLPFIMQTQSFHDHSIKQSKGSVNPYVNFSDLAWYEFDLPPTEEQRSQCVLLRSLWDLRDSYASAIRHGYSLRDSTIAHLYEHGTRGEPRAMTPLGLLPESWQVLPLHARYDIQLGKKLSPVAAVNGDLRPYLRNENVDWNRLDLSNVKEMCFTSDERTKVELRSGDIVACEGRHVGKAAMWLGQVAGMCCQNTLHRLRALSDDDVPEFMLHCLRYFHVTRRFVVDTAASTIPHLTLDRFRPMLFPFPPRDEQLRIADKVGQLDAGISAIEDRLRDTTQLLKRTEEVSFA